jgi:hypothetical protein
MLIHKQGGTVAGSIRFFVAMRDRTTMAATIAVDDLVPFVVRYRRRYRQPISAGSQTSAACDMVSQFSMYLNLNPNPNPNRLRLRLGLGLGLKNHAYSQTRRDGRRLHQTFRRNERSDNDDGDDGGERFHPPSWSAIVAAIVNRFRRALKQVRPVTWCHSFPFILIAILIPILID